MRRRGFLRHPGDRGFTLVELMMAVAILGIGTAFITSMFLNGYRAWKRSFDEMLLQQGARRSMAIITRALREGSPGSVQISTPAGMPQFSQIAFRDGRGKGWIFRQRMKGTDPVASASVFLIEYVVSTADWPSSPPGVISATMFLADDVSMLSFVYPSFQNGRLIDVGITMRKLPYRNGSGPVTVQLVERVLLRNP